MTQPAVPPATIPPPATIDELRALALSVARGETDLPLGRKAREALGRILELRGSPAVLSITTLAETLGVHPSTLTRLSRSLGYPGFGAFQEVLLSASLTRPGAFYSHQAQAALASGDASSRSAAERLCRENQANIDRFLASFDAASFDAAAARIASARRVVIFGRRQFHAFAAFLGYGLQLIRGDVSLLDAYGMGVAEGLAPLSGDDVLIAASCAPYTASVVETAGVAHERGLSVIAITDSIASPLVDVSQTALIVPHKTSFLSNSMTSFIACAECLINAVAAVMGERAASALAGRDALIESLKIEI